MILAVLLTKNWRLSKHDRDDDDHDDSDHDNDDIDGC